MSLHEIEPPDLLSPPLISLNHVSFLCTSVESSVKFYQQVLGFDLIKRPSCFDFKGAWLHRYGIAIHLLQRSSLSDAPVKPSVIDPKGNHISFQCVDVGMMKKKLEDMGMEYVTAAVKEGGIVVEQLFFHDPDGNMIEICDCEKLPVLPLSSACPPKMFNSHGNTKYFQR
ncbi:glyoxylase I 4-like [Typha angustifolia]|uniref:glyoxylase I 4-like n=1 Tax=Typha angustifolia TaxID=59011 RepID=UPI003C2D390F